MPDALLATLGGPGQRRFDIPRVLAPAMTLLCAAMVVIAADGSEQVKYLGLTVMMASMSVYVFALRGLPLNKRPPVHFSRLSLRLVGAFCLGTILCGAGMPGLFGFMMQFVPSFAAVAASDWLKSDRGRAWRKTVAARDC